MNLRQIKWRLYLPHLEFPKTKKHNVRLRCTKSERFHDWRATRSDLSTRPHQELADCAKRVQVLMEYDLTESRHPTDILSKADNMYQIRIMLSSGTES